VSAALDVRHVMRMRHIVICGLSGCGIFFPRYLINSKVSEKRVIEHKMCFDFIYNVGPKDFLFCEEMNEF
jgi:hypothetical protein